MVEKKLYSKKNHFDKWVIYSLLCIFISQIMYTLCVKSKCKKYSYFVRIKSQNKNVGIHNERFKFLIFSSLVHNYTQLY